MDDSLIKWLNRFLCHMYGWKGKDSVKNKRNRMYCQYRAKKDCKKFPPCEDVLQLHIMRANYQAFTLRQSLLAQQAENDSLKNGWCLDEKGCSDIKWVTCNPTSDKVTAFILKLSIKNNFVENETLHQSTGKCDVMIATVKIIKIFRFGCKTIIVIKLINS